MSASLPVALAGIGKIAVDQHVPALAASSDWRLEANVSRQGQVDGVPSSRDFPVPAAGAAFHLCGSGAEGPDREYPRLYAHMADLVRGGKRDVDLTPMVHVSDAMPLGRRLVTEPFHF